jgi:probable F420-dependent oxidoreductase
MQVETLLPLGKVDPGLRAPDVAMDLHAVFDDARELERLGYDSLVIEECKEDPYIVAALAAQATTRLKLGTAVAIAFPRSPASTAMTAWTLQRLSRGRFTLGLGTQVRAHIERRYGMTWSPAGPWIRDYVHAVRAVWACWQTGKKLDFNSEHYKLSLMVPLFDPGPIEHPDIPIHLAAVNPIMSRIAGECADGMRPHPVCTAEYIEKIMLPAARAGAAKAGRDDSHFAVAIKPLIATARTEQELEKRIRDIRARVAFYCSTPGYRAAFEFHGLGDLARRMSVLSREQRWEEMPGMIDDEVLNLYATIGSFAEIGRKLQQRYGHVVTNAEFSIPIASEADKETLAGLVRDLQAGCRT